MLLPKVNYVGKSSLSPDGERVSDLSPGDTKVIIEEGEMLCGTIDKKTVGKTAGGLIHRIWLDWSPQASANFIQAIQRLVNYWLMQHGFSIGVSDTVADEGTLDSIVETLDKAKAKVSTSASMRKNTSISISMPCPSLNPLTLFPSLPFSSLPFPSLPLKVEEFVKEGQSGELDVQPGRTMMESFEQFVNTALNTARDDAGKIGQRSLARLNSFRYVSFLFFSFLFFSFLCFFPLACISFHFISLHHG